MARIMASGRSDTSLTVLYRYTPITPCTPIIKAQNMVITSAGQNVMAVIIPIDQAIAKPIINKGQNIPAIRKARQLVHSRGDRVAQVIYSMLCAIFLLQL